MYIDVRGILQSYEDMTVDMQEIIDAENRTSLNAVVSEYIYRIYEERSIWSCLTESQRIHDCCKIWRVDNYPRHNISDIKFVSHCRSKYCLHCQKLLQASRLSKFVPLLEAASEEYDLYHIVLTIPNVPGVKLEAVCKELLPKAFKRLIRFFNGKDSIRGIDFTQYGYYAALRSLEVTYGKYGEDDFHPHYHCIFALKKGLSFEQTEMNPYSYDYGVFKRKFSKFEVFIQKLWRLIVDSERERAYRNAAFKSKLGAVLPKSDPVYNAFSEAPKPKKSKKTVVKQEAIDALDLGYSCEANLIGYDPENDRLEYMEVFKYVCKCTSENSVLFTYEQFCALYFALKSVHSMQGYGAWARCKFYEEDVSFDEFYLVFISYLRQTERPISRILELSDIKRQIQDKSTAFITRRSFKRWLKRADETLRTSLDSAFSGIQPIKPDKPCFVSTDFCVAYYRYLRCRSESSVFADIRERERKAKEESRVLTLSPEQLSFLNTIF